jgi:hypothetical protein
MSSLVTDAASVVEGEETQQAHGAGGEAIASRMETQAGYQRPQSRRGSVGGGTGAGRVARSPSVASPGDTASGKRSAAVVLQVAMFDMLAFEFLFQENCLKYNTHPPAPTSGERWLWRATSHLPLEATHW